MPEESTPEMKIAEIDTLRESCAAMKITLVYLWHRAS